MSSLYKVPLTKILDIKPHTNSDNLELAYVYGFQVVVRKGVYKVGDLVVYIPIDSILPIELENHIFGPNAKVKLHKSRVRQIKLRGLASQGMLLNLNDLFQYKFLPPDSLNAEDLSEALGITKYEPPQRDYSPTSPKFRNKPKENPRFHKYNGIDNIKWMPQYFEGKEVVIQEKLHGSNCRVAYLPAVANTFWKKILKFLRLLPQYEYCYGSNNVQLQERKGNKGYYGSDVYGAVLKKVDAFSKLKPGETVYGELIGEGIQKNYDYGHKEHHFVIFDVKVEKEDGTQEYLNPEAVELYAQERGFDFVPVLMAGEFNKEVAYTLTKGASVYNPVQKVREGIVIKLRNGYGSNGEKQVLKWINEDYLADKENSDFN